MEVIYSKGAKEDIRKSIEYYEREPKGLGKMFWNIVELSAEKICLFPNASGIINKSYRRFLIEKFPYGIVYRIEKDFIFIAVVMHLKRKPFFWLHEKKYLGQ